MKRISALLAALAFAPSAYAADLGGNCCSDLEERIAELEATTARKGNRKVSLTVYGAINKALLYVDDDSSEEKSIIENGASASRFGFKGDAKIADGYSAGYVLEVGVGSFSLEEGNSNDLGVRHSYVYLNTPVGKVSLGQTSQATDGIAEVSTANTEPVMNTLNLKPLDSTSLFDGDRTNLVRYDSPVVGGFVASASWSNDTDETWDVALRYAGEFAGLKVAAGVGYLNLDLADTKVTSGSVSVKHVGTGLFGTVAAGLRDEGAVEHVGYHGVVGIERNILGFGATTFFGEYMKGKTEETSYVPGDDVVIEVEDGDDIVIPTTIKVTDKESSTMWGVGLVQAVDAAALDLYALYRVNEDEDFSYGMLGARIKF